MSGVYVSTTVVEEVEIAQEVEIPASIYLDIECNNCGETLEVADDQISDEDTLFVDPCPKCLQAARDESQDIQLALDDAAQTNSELTEQIQELERKLEMLVSEEEKQPLAD
jgi:DNA-directed RNA polymerase subunit M/transcription elongation factor TFIIS